MPQLSDRHGRMFPYLRLQVLDACNFSCSYCLPNGYQAVPGRPAPLRLDEIARLLRGFAAVGMHKLRLTGGEPSLRKDLTEIIALAANTPGIDTIALTSNGCLLRKRQRQWRAAGLNAINISVDSLRPDVFQRITGHDRLPDILHGIDALLAAGMPRVKLNAVLLRGVNDGELPGWLEYIRQRPVGVRFIELMQTGTNLAYFQRHHLRAESLEQQLREQGWALQARAAEAGPAREYRHPQYAGHIGIIAPYSKDFCAGCNRLRVTAQGDLRLCLFGNIGIPLREHLQSDDQHDALLACLHSQMGLKRIGHRLDIGQTGLTENLATIGG